MSRPPSPARRPPPCRTGAPTQVGPRQGVRHVQVHPGHHHARVRCDRADEGVGQRERPAGPRGGGDGLDELAPRGVPAVGDVVGAARHAPLEGGDGGCRGILVMDERDAAPPGARHRQRERVEHPAHDGDVETVEQPVPQRDAAAGRERLLFGGQQRVQHGQRALVVGRADDAERGLLGERRGAVVAETVAEHDRLGDEARCTDCGRCLDQVLGAVDPQPVRLAHAREGGRSLRERRQLMDHRVGLEPLDGAQQGIAVQHVGDDRRGPALGEGGSPGRGAGDADHLVTAFEQLRDERRAEGAGGAGEEDSHGVPSVGVVDAARFASAAR